MRIVLAPDKFKGSLDAPAVARALRDGIGSVTPTVTVDEVPVADGGDGTVDVLLRAGFTPRPVEVAGPLGDPVATRMALRGDVAVVETAAAVGLAALGGRAPDAVRASSYGLGQAIAAAVDGGAREVVVGLGGSAGTDGGAGLLQALGARLLDGGGAPIRPGGGGLAGLESVDLGQARARLAGVRVVAACDVANVLLGASGAARVYAPQKGASAAEVDLLESGLRRLAAAAERAGEARVAERPGTGAAGGIGYALALLGATVRGGADLVLDLLGFAGVLAGADLVVTGEGSLDTQSLQGKAPLRVAAAAAGAGIPAVAAVGRCALTREQVSVAGFAAVYALTDLEPDLDRCMANAAPLLRAAGARIAGDRARRHG